MYPQLGPRRLSGGCIMKTVFALVCALACVLGASAQDCRSGNCGVSAGVSTFGGSRVQYVGGLCQNGSCSVGQCSTGSCSADCSVGQCSVSSGRSYVRSGFASRLSNLFHSRGRGCRGCR